MSGLGFATCRAEDSSSIDFGCDAAMIDGRSPTYGFPEFGTRDSHTGDLFASTAAVRARIGQPGRCRLHAGR